jgi:hypothetical protein
VDNRCIGLQVKLSQGNDRHRATPQLKLGKALPDGPRCTDCRADPPSEEIGADRKALRVGGCLFRVVGVPGNAVKGRNDSLGTEPRRERSSRRDKATALFRSAGEVVQSGELLGKSVHLGKHYTKGMRDRQGRVAEEVAWPPVANRLIIGQVLSRRHPPVNWSRIWQSFFATFACPI